MLNCRLHSTKRRQQLRRWELRWSQRAVQGAQSGRLAGLPMELTTPTKPAGKLLLAAHSCGLPGCSDRPCVCVTNEGCLPDMAQALSQPWLVRR